ncbi:MAG: LysE/ArgO family amino acid transporter [Burkholderiaceae bacterium]
MPALPASATAYLAGLVLCASLIIAIGAQNAFVLRQGLRRRHVGAIVAFCATADAVLLAVGVFGAGSAFARSPVLAFWTTVGGAVFLAAYGALALRRALRPGDAALQPDADRSDAASMGRALAQAAAFTLLNPHVYLDTVLLAGAIGAQQPAALRGWFVAGGASASLVWFASLGYGAARLAPWFASPRAWRVLDSLIGLTMLTMAAALVRHAVG